MAVQVLANLTAQHSNSYSGGPQSHMSQQSHITHYQAHSGAPQMQMRPQFSQPQMMAATPGQLHMQAARAQHHAMQAAPPQVMQAQQAQQAQHMVAQQMQAQRQAQHQAQHQGQQRPPGMRGGPQPGQAAPRPYTVHNVSPLDDPLMTALH